MWALKNGDLDEVKDYVAKVSGDAPLRGGVVVKPRAHRELGRRGRRLDAEGPGSVWPSVPGNRCVAKAAVACVTPPPPRVAGVWVVSFDPYRPALFHPSYGSL